MGMIKTIATKTIVTIAGTALSIYTFYQKCTSFMKLYISDYSGTEEGVKIEQGDLIYKTQDFSDDFYIDSNGDLIVNGVNVDKYSIIDGELYIDEDFCGNKLYTLTLYTFGGAVETSLISAGSTLSVPDPSTSEYTFVGWYTDSAFTIPYDVNTVFTGDLTLYGKFDVTYTAINFGFLYNAFALNDSRNIANVGARIATKTDWELLAANAGGVAVLGGKLKAVDSNYWNDPNTGATNEYGFNLKGCGVRRSGSFSGIKELDKPWTGTASGATFQYENQFDSTSENDSITVTFSKYAQSTRIIIESTSLAEGETGTYIGNDGKIYPTVAIGDGSGNNVQEWVVQPLAETKYQNGDWIDGFNGGVYTPIDGVTWEALTTGALCAYFDNLAYV